ncbi:MAG TPA: hypothetical protein VLH61_04430 [Bacteroidales bacterium]|nr:hypothetical protein [Bacteroidales bacterium]
MYLRTFILVFLAIIFNTTAFAKGQQQTQEPAWGIRFTGFVRSDYWFDSRKILSIREDIFLLIPAPIQPDITGYDLNATPSFNYSAIFSRLTGIITGPEAFGAKTSGVLDADFSGVSNADVNGFRLRHAFARLRWEKTELLFGQFWHPMFVPEVFPHVIALNTGAPFQPFIRSPQIAVSRFWDNYSLQLALISQRDHASDGPLGVRSDYMRNSLIPNIHLQFQHRSENTVLGVAADFKRLRPRLVTEAQFETNEILDNWSFMAFGRHKINNLTIRGKAIYGQNLFEHMMLGGYAVRTSDPVTRRETYTPTNHLFVWGNLTHGRNFQVSLFAGFAKNFGTTHENLGIFYGRGSNIDYMYRIAPSISFTSNRVQVATELEYTSAAYGQPDSHGRINDSQEVANLRLQLSLFYNF